MSTEQYGLEKVIEDLKGRGIRAGEEEAARLVAEARQEGARIVEQAREKASLVERQAQEEKRRTIAAMEAELSQAARVGLAAFRQSVEGGFLVPQLDESLKGSLENSELMGDLVLEMVRGFVASGMEQADLEVILPEKRRADLESLILAKLLEQGHKGVVVAFDDSLSFGFSIRSARDGFGFDLTEEGFREILLKYISPRFRDAFYNMATGESKPASAPGPAGGGTSNGGGAPDDSVPTPQEQA